MPTASEIQHSAQMGQGQGGAAQSVVPGTEPALMLQRLSNWQSRVPARNPNKLRGSRDKGVRPQ